MNDIYNTKEWRGNQGMGSPAQSFGLLSTQQCNEEVKPSQVQMILDELESQVECLHKASTQQHARLTPVLGCSSVTSPVKDSQERPPSAIPLVARIESIRSHVVSIRRSIEETTSLIEL